MDNVLAKIGLFCQYFRFWQKLVILELQCSIYWHGSGFFWEKNWVFFTRIGYSLPRIVYILERFKHFAQELGMFGKN